MDRFRKDAIRRLATRIISLILVAGLGALGIHVSQEEVEVFDNDRILWTTDPERHSS